VSSTTTAVGADFVDIPVPSNQTAPLNFTFFWTKSARWEGRNFAVGIDPRRRI
jgi:hypothetical protein